MTGQFVHGELISSDASAGVSPVMYDQSLAARTLLSTEVLTLQTFDIVCTDALNIEVFQDAVGGTGTRDAGEFIAGGGFAANGGLSKDWRGEGFQLKRGNVPRVKSTAAGNVKISFTGYIRKT